MKKELRSLAELLSQSGMSLVEVMVTMSISMIMLMAVQESITYTTKLAKGLTGNQEATRQFNLLSSFVNNSGLCIRLLNPAGNTSTNFNFSGSGDSSGESSFNISLQNPIDSTPITTSSRLPGTTFNISSIKLKKTGELNTPYNDSVTTERLYPISAELSISAENQAIAGTAAIGSRNVSVKFPMSLTMRKPIPFAPVDQIFLVSVIRILTNAIAE
jgi:type II secretory pathway pseudopilin PulG